MHSVPFNIFCCSSYCLLLCFSSQILQHTWPCVLDSSTEQPEWGTHLPIDTEFVRLQQAEIEILATGDKQVIRPIRENILFIKLDRIRVKKTSSNLQIIEHTVRCSPSWYILAPLPLTKWQWHIWFSQYFLFYFAPPVTYDIFAINFSFHFIRSLIISPSSSL